MIPFPELPHRFLKPGEIVAGDESLTVTTLLGSCVAVALHSRSAGFGAICHAFLPSCGGGRRCRDGHGLYRHVDCAITAMLERFATAGIARAHIVAKIFGGATILYPDGDPDVSVGAKNVREALAVLAAQGVRVAAQDTGGGHGRKVVFLVRSGEIFLKRLGQGSAAPLRVAP